MHIFVINLERDYQRRKFIESQLDGLQLPFEIMPGVLGSALSAEELKVCYSDKKAKRNLCKSLAPALLGCSLSHTKVYREIIARELACALILEDDVVLPASLPCMIGELERTIHIGRPEVVLLSPAKGYKKSLKRRVFAGGYQILPYKDGYYTSSYIVTNLAAQTLLKELYPVGDEADCWLRLKRYKVADIYVLDPFLIEQNQSVFGSSTTEDLVKHLQHGFRSKVLFKARRVWAKSVDCIYGLYRRTFVPYAGGVIGLEAGPAKQVSEANQLLGRE
jgi:glycosyl transferase family 25